MENKDNCCNTNNDRGILKGIIFGLVPHTFCIAFISFSAIGATFATARFKELLLAKNFFYYLIGISFVFATITSAVYLKRINFLNLKGIKSKWRYLATLYSITIMTNLIMFFAVFPVMANINFNDKAINENQLVTLILSVEIPCSGHAPLIIDELKKDSGVSSVNFKLPNIFTIKYDSGETSPDKITSIEVFKTYKAEVKN